MARWGNLLEATSTKPPPLLDFVPEVSPELDRPSHLAPLAEAFERATRHPIRLVVSVPPQHGKSELAFHWFAWVLRQCSRPLLYITYSDDFARTQMRRARSVAHRAGVEFNDSGAIKEWYAANGGTLWATGIGGSVTGRPGGIILVDDPIKDWAAAQSRNIRDNTDHWLKSAVLTRAHPESSVVVVHTRWHEDDQAGRLAEEGWEVINLPAIDTEGDALWPDHRPVQWLEEQRVQVGDRIFAALYQGQPRPDGGEIFQPPETCTTADVPTTGRRSFGVDLAYTEKTTADYSVVVELLARRDGRFYVASVHRKQVRAPDFAMVLKRCANTAPGAPMRFYGSGTEKGAAQFFERSGIPLKTIQASADKRVRAEAAAAAWNAGKIIVPADAPWAKAFIDEVTSFTGSGDAHDDQVDALAAAFDAVATGWGPSVISGNKRRMSGARRAF